MSKVFARIFPIGSEAVDCVRNHNKDILVKKDRSLNTDYNNDRLELSFDWLQTEDMAKGWRFGNCETSSHAVLLSPEFGTSREQFFTLSVADDLSIWMCRTCDQELTVSLQFRKSFKEHKTKMIKQPMLPEINCPYMVCMPPQGPHHWIDFDVEIYDGTDTASYNFQFPNHRSNDSSDYEKNLRLWINSYHIQLPGRDTMNSATLPSRFTESPLRRHVFFVRKIGKGGGGRVDQWIDLYTGYQAALKTLNRLPGAIKKSTTRGQSTIAYGDIQNEIVLMKKCKHPHVIQLLHADKEPVPRILMPYYEHSNIGNLVVSQGPLQPEQYSRALFQLLQGIEYIHESLGVAHRDIKPDNILVKSIKPLHIVLSDFGLAKVTAEVMHTYCGTSWYWAPDLFDEEIQASGYQASVDIWSTGVVFFEWIYHRRPNYAPYDMSCPADGRRWTLGWAQLLVKTVASRCSKSTNDTLETTALDLLKHMLVIDANSRYTATRCLDEGRKSGLFEQSDTVNISYDDDADSEPGSDENGTFVSEDSAALTVLNHNVEKRMQSIVQASCDRIMHISGRMLRETADRDAALMGSLFEAPLDEDDQAVADDLADSCLDIEQPQDLDATPPESAKVFLPDRVQAPPKIPLVKTTTLPKGRLTSENLVVVDNELKAMAIETPGTAQDSTLDKHCPGLRDLIS